MGLPGRAGRPLLTPAVECQIGRRVGPSLEDPPHDNVYLFSFGKALLPDLVFKYKRDNQTALSGRRILMPPFFFRSVSPSPRRHNFPNPATSCLAP